MFKQLNQNIIIMHLSCTKSRGCISNTCALKIDCIGSQIAGVGKLINKQYVETTHKITLSKYLMSSDAFIESERMDGTCLYASVSAASIKAAHTHKSGTDVETT